MGQTVFVTGATGYVARHIVRQLLDAGHKVVGSARDAGRDGEMRTALAPALANDVALENYRTVALDLTRAEGWAAALAGADVLMHTASPFPIASPKREDELIGPAVEGTLRALRAARSAGVARVVLTSSAVAVYEDGRSGATYSEDAWSDPNWAGISAYSKSKTLAERAAWDFVGREAPEMSLSTINPTLVLGAPLGGHFGTSVGFIERLMAGRDPMLARLSFGICDVGDVALAHVRAMRVDGAAGGRHIINDRALWVAELAKMIKAQAPSARVARRVAPDLLIRLMGLFDPAIRGIVPSLGREFAFDNARMRDVLGIVPRRAEASVAETVRYLA